MVRTTELLLNLSRYPPILLTLLRCLSHQLFKSSTISVQLFIALVDFFRLGNYHLVGEEDAPELFVVGGGRDEGEFWVRGGGTLGLGRVGEEVVGGPLVLGGELAGLRDQLGDEGVQRAAGDLE